jgi:site-specific recombinase XerD
MKNVSVSFLLKKSKKNKAEKSPLYARIKLGTDLSDLSTGFHLKDNEWDSAKQKAKAVCSQAADINKHIHAIRSAAYGLEADCRLVGTSVTLDAIRQRIKGEQSSKTLLQAFALHNESIRKQIGNGYSQVTLDKYTLTCKKISEFLKTVYNKEDIVLTELKPSFVFAFENYLKSEQRLFHNTVIKHIKNLKKIIKYSIHQEWLKSNPFECFICCVKEVTRQSLTADEIQKIKNKEFESERVTVVRDVFLFCCYTGLSYSDVLRLSKKDLQQLSDDVKFIISKRTKTGIEFRVPILSQADSIIQKYEPFSSADKRGRLFPVKSNQKMNEYLKEIADRCGITKRLTCHIARHTFATTVTLANGVSLESVKAMLGHKNIRTTQIYARMTDPRLIEEMKSLNERLKHK